MFRRLHVFANPDDITTEVIDEEGMNWARCTDRERFVEIAAILFHADAEPVDPGGLLRCTHCGEFNNATAVGDA
jgi:hypothetical protein